MWTVCILASHVRAWRDREEVLLRSWRDLGMSLPFRMSAVNPRPDGCVHAVDGRVAASSVPSLSASLLFFLRVCVRVCVCHRWSSSLF